jgi:hydroxymethylbilane synthase
MKLVIGTRGSALALWQAEYVRDRVLELPGQPVESVELQIIKTRGDAILDVTLSKVGGKGLFVKELEVALMDGQVDLAVHSLKDMPAIQPEGLELCAYPVRADPRDALVLQSGLTGGLDALPQGAIVGTSSLRRQAQILALRPDLSVVPIRGNVQTRLRKLDEGVDGMSATLLAVAGLKRLELDGRISTALDASAMIPAVGQGALAVQTRSSDSAVRDIIARLDHADTRSAVLAERAFLARLEGGCQVPIAGHAVLTGDALQLVGFVGTPDGKRALCQEITGPVAQAEILGETLADRLLSEGAADILAVYAGATGGSPRE